MFGLALLSLFCLCCAAEAEATSTLLSRFVVTRFVAEHHARLQSGRQHGVRTTRRTDTAETFVHARGEFSFWPRLESL
jgi:hypothetical protein